MPKNASPYIHLDEKGYPHAKFVIPLYEEAFATGKHARMVHALAVKKLSVFQVGKYVTLSRQENRVIVILDMDLTLMVWDETDIRFFMEKKEKNLKEELAVLQAKYDLKLKSDEIKRLIHQMELNMYTECRHFLWSGYPYVEDYRLQNVSKISEDYPFMGAKCYRCGKKAHIRANRISWTCNYCHALQGCKNPLPLFRDQTVNMGPTYEEIEMALKAIRENSDDSE